MFRLHLGQHVLILLFDNEEIGSVGATGAHSLFFENTVAELLLKMGMDSFVQTRLTMSRSKMLSSDVSAGVDPLFVNVNDKKNAAYLGNGIVFNKYTGSRGKSGSNDASLFENDQEKALAQAAESLELTGSASDKLAQLFVLSPVIDAFFDNTMVMADDVAVKNNRLALLSALVAKAKTVAAFNQLNTK